MATSCDQCDDVDEIGFATFLASCLFFHDVHGGRERGSAIDGGRERPRCLLTNGRGDPLICLAISFIFCHHSYGIRWRSGSESCAISRSVAPLTDLPALASADRAMRASAGQKPRSSLMRIRPCVVGLSKEPTSDSSTRQILMGSHLRESARKLPNVRYRSGQL